MAEERTELGSGATFVKDKAAKRWRVEIADLQKLIDAWGPRGKQLFIGLSKVLVAVDQLVVFEDLIQLNLQLPDTLRRERNLMTLVACKGGTLRELAAAVDEMNGGGIAAILKNSTDWEKLRTLCKYWKDKLARDLRNNIAFHLGDTELYEKGLAAMAAQGKPAVLVEADGATYADARSTFAHDMLLRGLDIEEADFDKHLRAGRDATIVIADQVNKILLQLLEVAGVDVNKLA